jgi:predicted nucleic acid-binding protein
MHILVDTNIVMDALAERPPFDISAKELLLKIETKTVQGSLAATTLTTIFYLMRKLKGNDKAKQLVADLLRYFEICAIDRHVLQNALNKSMSDFEDAVQDSAAELNGIPIIVTRNAGNFVGSTRQILDAEAFLKQLGQIP